MRPNRAALLWLLVAVPVAGCHAPPKEDLLARGEYLCLESKWDEAIPLLKQRLLENPQDAGAHYYLGRCYLNLVPVTRAWPMIAAGEWETALNLFVKSGRQSPIPRFSATYFELSCNLEMAKVYLKQIQLLAELNASPSSIVPYMEKLKRAAAAAKAVVPDSDDVKQLEQIVHGIAPLSIQGGTSL